MAIGWGGGTSTSVNTGANWSGGVNPANGNEVYLEGPVPRGLETNMAALTAVTLDKLGVHKSFNQVIGAAASPFDIGSTVLTFEGSGSRAFFTGTYTTVMVRTTRKEADAFNITGGTTTRLLVWMGNATLSGSATCTNAYVGYTGSPTSDSLLYIGSAVTMSTSLNMTAGYCETLASIPTAELSGFAKLRVKAGTVTTANLRAGGTLELVNGTLTTVNVYDGGVLDALDASAAPTITTINAYEGASLRLGKSTVFGANITVNVYGDLKEFTFDPSAVTLNVA